MALDPTEIRLSDSFLLSDFMGCDSVYRHGYANAVLQADRKKIREGEYLCNHVLQPLIEDQGPLSVIYGYISPKLSKKIVKYQDPDKPSYHRWDYGAAADIIVHDWVQMGVKGHEGDDPDSAPIYLAHWIDEYYDYSRMITYSESPAICIATRSYEDPRRAFYENRYEGKPKTKPRFITKPTDSQKRIEQGAMLELEYDWRGQGYPSYHAGARRGYEHVRLGRYVVLSDLLYSPRYVSDGIRNRPPTNANHLFWDCARDAAAVIDEICSHIQNRVSVIQGYESQGQYDWVAGNRYEMKVALPVGVNYKEVKELVEHSVHVGKVEALNFGRVLHITGMPTGRRRKQRG